MVDHATSKESSVITQLGASKIAMGDVCKDSDQRIWEPSKL